jgi:purine-binding chemotaxis protein CheW
MMTNQTPTKTTFISSRLDDNLALLLFEVNGQTYGLPVASIARIIEMVTITQLPDLPDSLPGIINLQGRAVPVMDLRRRFGLPSPTYGLHTPIILTDLNGSGQMLGLIVDIVEMVVHVPRTNLEIIETFIPQELVGQITNHAAHLAGVAKVERQMIPVLNLQALMTPIEKSQLSQMLDGLESPNRS